MNFLVMLSIVVHVWTTDLDLINILLTGDAKEIYNLSNPRKAVLNSVTFLHKIQLSNQQKATIWEVFKDGRDPHELVAEELRNITELLPAIPEDDLSNFNVRDWDIVEILGHVRYFTRPQATAVVNSLKTEWGADMVLQANHINKLSGLICGFSENELSKISKLEFERIDSVVFANLFGCSRSQLIVLYNQVINIYGVPQTWSDQLIKHIGMIILALNSNEIKKLQPSSLGGLDIEIITKFKPQLLEDLTPQQLEHLSSNSKMKVGVKLFKSSATQIDKLSFLLSLFLKTYLLLKY